ncbi:biotin synthase BioB [Salinivibrio sp. MA427]|uniref:biotin synthase BioB n=1 Tax=Salinivibrio sp. MA427 TaxID=1909455 RepID=UPI000989F738|nr:biotin synthase BioB [Salinivibrio sp. MA427]OOF16522.1 biotin synthase BioB [Salinivibrio sp. MA427]
MEIRHNWTAQDVQALFDKPFMDLLFDAQQVHREYHPANQVQVSTLLSIKTGACPEDCKYCPQSARYRTDVEKERLMEVEQVLEAAHKAKASGATRFCMGAAWKNPKQRDMPYLLDMIQGVKSLGLETCMTLGMLDNEQAQTLSEAGLDYYNHNLDTSPEFYGNVITTRTYQERLDTLSNVREAGMKVCSGGIIGLGEDMNEQMQTLCFMAGANSIFYGCKLLTTPNPDEDADMQLFKKLGINREAVSQKPDQVTEHDLLEQVAERVASRPQEGDLFYDASV